MPTPERNLPKSDSLSANVGSIAGEPVNTWKPMIGGRWLKGSIADVFSRQ